VRDLGIDDSDGPIGINLVEMTTPAPNQNVWPDSDVNRVNPMTITASAVVPGFKIPPSSLISTTRMISGITTAGVVS
jgi:hypothetical protein